MRVGWLFPQLSSVERELDPAHTETNPTRPLNPVTLTHLQSNKYKIVSYTG